MRARALEFTAPRNVSLTEIELPPLQAGEVLVRTLYSGISSGTELLAYRGEIDPSLELDETIAGLSGTFSYPFRYGYSCVGSIEQSQADLPVGSQVFCFHPHQDRFVARGSDLVVLQGADVRAATLFPLVETALQVTLDCGQVHEETVLVFGLGPVGLLVSLLLDKAGADVLAIEPVAWRRDLAEGLGIESRPPDSAGDAVSERTHGRGAPIAVECSGNPGALTQSLRALAHEGTVVVASWYGTKPVTLPLGEEFHRRRLSIRSSQVSTIPARLAGRWTIERRRDVALALLDELPLKRLATHEFSFTDASSAFDALDRMEEGLIHAALHYPEMED